MVRILLGGVPVTDHDVARIVQDVGLNLPGLSNPHGRIPAAQLAAVWSRVAQELEDPHLGLHVGEQLGRMPKGHVLFSAMANSPTLKRALERYCRYHDIMGDFAQVRLSVGEERTVLGLSSHRESELHFQHVECIFASIVSSLSQLSPARFGGRVHFVHSRPTSSDEHERILGPETGFAQPRNEIVFENAYLRSGIETADAGLLEVLDQYAERLLRHLRPDQDWTGRVASLLSKNLCDGKPTLSQVAHALAVSPRSLQDKLRQEGTGYQAVLDEARQRMAISHLERGNLSLVEIAFLLGYADQSAFTNAFRRWTGQSPSRFRRDNTSKKAQSAATPDLRLLPQQRRNGQR